MLDQEACANRRSKEVPHRGTEGKVVTGSPFVLRVGPLGVRMNSFGSEMGSFGSKVVGFEPAPPPEVVGFLLGPRRALWGP